MLGVRGVYCVCWVGVVCVGWELFVLGMCVYKICNSYMNIQKTALAVT